MPGFNINSLSLSGTLTRDPELRTTGGGTSVCSMRLAYNTRRKNNATGEWEDAPNFIDLTAWAGIGEWYAKNLTKGTQIVVHGELRWREWEAEDGTKRHNYDLNVDSLVPVTRRDSVPSSDIPNGDRDFAPPAVAATSGNEDIPF